ncbi:MoaD/ThiS family protein [Terrabacter sp. NPDC080008]|uniref:MoaD/ThiS family protein n=1 Tax=Terrabacter sp. NPDC080008 TaxID=3155176 RepID=UPI00344EF45B
MASNAPRPGTLAAAQGPESAAVVTVTVRYWAAARAAAGTDSDHQDGATVGEVVDAATVEHPGLERVTRVASFLLDGRKVGRDEPVRAGATVEVLPPFAGG